MKGRLFRYLRADEIDVRVAQVLGNSGVLLLLYKDARVDQNLLDETFGPFGWKREHQLIGDRLYCTVSVKDPETDEWVSKQDVGTESSSEKEKGQASDSFKRACFNWGIGRELYTGPDIKIFNSDSDTVVKIKQNGQRTTTYDRFKVTDFEVENGVITKLAIVNEDLHKVVFTYRAAEFGNREANPMEDPPAQQTARPAAPARRQTAQAQQAAPERTAEATQEAARKAVETARQAPVQISAEEVFQHPKELISNSQVDSLRLACEERKIRMETVLKLVKAEDPFKITNVQWYNIVLGGKYWERLKAMEDAERETA